MWRFSMRDENGCDANRPVTFSAERVAWPAWPPNHCTDNGHTLYWDLLNFRGDIMLASSKTQRVDLRISAAAKQMIQAAAQAQDKTVSEFLLDSGLASAAETLADRRLFILDNAQWNAFQAALDAPPRERPRLAHLMTTGR